ncbi:MAG: AAA family ATPase [Gammaproteobacteria bacterium]|nr:AAA family ATPase [Gammaproteobacteria bacterium]
MYYEHFGFRYPPFKITPDTSLFFPGGNRGAILEALSYAIRNGEGIVKVVGEVGSGKTMLCRMLEIELPKNIEIVYLANPRLSPDNILHAIAFELKLPVSDDDNRLVVMQSLQNYLLERHAENRQVVVFIEEAQSMPLATLEEIRLLSNLETNQHKLLQIVLFGQPELDDMLAKPQIRQLKERITYHFNLEPLRQNEIRDYMNARLRSCGYRGGTLFTTGATSLIARYSQGLLRRVNILADKALLAAYAGNSRRVGRRQVMAAVRDSEFRPLWTHYLWPAALTVFLLAVSMLAYQQFDGNWRHWSWPQAETTTAPVAADTQETDAAPAESTAPARQETRSPPPREPAIDTRPLGNGYAWAGGDGRWSHNHGMQAGAVMQTVPDAAGALSPETGPVAANTTGEDMTVSAMQAFLDKLPPEEVWLDAPAVPGITCERCTAIIYRPLQGSEKM